MPRHLALKTSCNNTSYSNKQWQRMNLHNKALPLNITLTLTRTSTLVHDEIHAQLRTYLAAKNWLTTFEDPTGPAAPVFDNDINKKIYNKLLILCKAGHAVTYVKKAAEFDGHGAGRKLLLRYDGFSKQRKSHFERPLSNYATSMALTLPNTSTCLKRFATNSHTTTLPNC
jgi:hypothetical protein